MKMKYRIHLTLIIVLVLPVFVFIISSLLFTAVWYSGSLESEDISAPAQIRSALKDILEGGFPEDPRGIIMVLNANADTVFMVEGARGLLENVMEHSPRETYAWLMKGLPKDNPFSLAFYRYHGEQGIVIYEPRVFPRLLLTRLSWIILLICYIGLILFPILVLNIILRPMMQSLTNLEETAIQISRGNLDCPVKIPKKDRGIQFLESAMEKMRQELKENQEQQARLLLSVSHDLMTPLTSIKGYVEAIEDGLATSPGDQKKYTGIILEKSKLLEERISALLHFSKLNTSEWKAHFQSIEIFAFLEESSAIFRNDSMLAGKSFSSLLEITEATQMQGDRQMLFRVLENLFDNGLRYSGPHDQIRLRAWEEEESIHILMEDSGPGITETYREKIFETFFRIGQDRNSRGMGIGLASAKTIVENHGGSICYEDSPLGGSAFHIKFPKHVHTADSCC